jgi:predicted RNase H-like HicB family nuclease
MRVKMGLYYDGEFWCARGMDVDIITQGKTLDEIYRNIEEAVLTHFGESAQPIDILILSEIRLGSATASSG